MNDTINKLIFEFTCTSEQAAKTMRDDILNYSTNQINTILSEILSKKQDNNLIWKINKLEIDLGNIYLNDIGTEGLNYKFKTLLTKNIEESLHNLHHESDSNAVALSTNKAQIDIIRELLLSGDLPWWIDKKSFPGIDRTIKTIIDQDTEELKAFLNEQMNNRDAKHRLKIFCSPETILLLNRIVPGIIDTSPKNPFIISDDKVILEKLSDTNLQLIVTSLNKRITSGSQNLKLLLIQGLLKNFNAFLFSDIKLLDVFTQNELSELELFFKQEQPGNIKDEQAIQILQRLNTYQLEFLLHQSGNKQDLSVSTSSGHVDKSNKKRVSYIINRLKTENPQLIEKLYNASEENLRSLQYAFRQYKNPATTKKMMVTRIIEHSNFQEYNLLNLFTKSPLDFSAPAGDSDKLLNLLAIIQRFRKIQSHLHKMVRNLTNTQSDIFNDILMKGEITSPSERKTIVHILTRLPAKDLQMISQLVLLNKEEIESITPPPLYLSTGSIDLKKTIIENAGLILLATYLPMFFHHLGYTENGKFKTKTIAYRALYLLQYIVNGRQRNYEYVLQLNKLLCGFNINEPILGYKRLTKFEKTEAEDLITSAINHWKALKSTSIKGFQISFLQRKGILTEKEDLWTLQVEKSSYDLLLDSIPWSFSLIKLPWMKKMIQVEW